MPSSDVQIRAPGTQAAPLDYTLSDAAQIVPKAVRATYDGTGAGSAFLPMLIITGPSGIEVARCPTSTSVAAGGTAEVSWFPRVGGGGAASASTGLPAGYAQRTSNKTLGAGVYQVQLQTFITDDTTLYTWSALDNMNVYIHAHGVYAVDVSFQLGANAPPYTNALEYDANLFDANNVVMDQLTGPAFTDQQVQDSVAGDTFTPQGRCTFNAPTSAVLPLRLTSFVTVSQASLLFNAAFLVSQLNSVPLT